MIVKTTFIAMFLFVVLFFGSLAKASPIFVGEYSAFAKTSDFSNPNKANEDKPDLTHDNLKPYEHPSAPAYNVGGWYFVAGFSVEPQKNYYGHISSKDSNNKRIRVHTEIAKNDASVIDTTFKWYIKFKDKNWKDIKDSKDNMEHYGISIVGTPNNDIEIHAEKEVDFALQSSAQVWPIMFNPVLYSEPTILHFIEGNVSANSVTFSQFPEYLWVTQGARKGQKQVDTVTAIPSPINAIGKMHYQSLDENIATVDDNGQITVNNNNQSEEVTIKAYFDNEDPVVINQQPFITKKIKVGPILTIQDKPEIGNPVIFQIHGNFEDERYTVEWFQRKGGQSIKLSLGVGSKSQYIISKLEQKDRYMKVFAKITGIDKTHNTSANEKKLKSFETNDVEVDVNESLPTNDYGQTIENTTWSESNKSPYHVSGAIVMDSLRHRYVIYPKNKNAKDVILTQRFVATIGLCENVENIYLGTKKLNKNEYEIIDNMPENTRQIVIDRNIPLATATVNPTIEIYSHPTADYKMVNYLATATYSETGKRDGKDYSFQDDFNENKVSFSNVSFHLKANDLNFGPVVSQTNKLYTRSGKNKEDIILELQTNPFMGLSYVSKSIEMRVDDDFVNKDDKSKQVKLRFDYVNPSDNEYEDPNEGVQISIPKFQGLNQELAWKKNQGLMLRFDNNNLIESGNYSSSIIWIIHNAPK